MKFGVSSDNRAWSFWPPNSSADSEKCGSLVGEGNVPRGRHPNAEKRKVKEDRRDGSHPAGLMPANSVATSFPRWGQVRAADAEASSDGVK